MFNKCIILCLATLISSSSALDVVPDYIQVCQKGDPNLTDCIIRSVNHLRPYLKEGIPELQIPSIEPLLLGDLVVSGNTNSNGLSIIAKDILTYGPSEFIIKKLNIVTYGEEYHFDIFLPHLYVEGAYTIDGRILLLPLKGSGKFAGNFTSSLGSVKAYLPKRASNNENIKVTKFDIKIKVGNGNIKLKNLFFGDKFLGDAINDVINQNFDVLSQDIIPLVERALQKTFKKIGNKLGKHFTYEQLFPST